MTQPVPYPDMAFQVAFNADPNSSDNPLWTDLSAMVMGGDGITRGELYELAQAQAATPTVVLRDPLELLNPLNPASPWQQTILPYRGCCWQTMYPRAGTGNMLGDLQYNSPYHIDPTFEIYPQGTFPAGFQTFGGTVAAVSGSNPFLGSQCLAWGVNGGGSTFQGVALPFLCIPGRVYTASVYVRQTAANTVQVALLGHSVADSTTVAGSYQRLQFSFTADQPTLTLFVGHVTAPANSGTLSIDAIQIEPVAPLNTNIGFEQGMAGWTLTGGGQMTTDTGWFRSGSHSLKMTPDGVSSTVYCEASVVPVTASARYLISAQGWSPTGTGANPVGVRVDWYNSSMGLVSTSITPISALAARVQNLYTSLETAPVGAAFAGVHVLMTGTPAASNVVWWDEVGIYPCVASAFNTSGPAVYPIFRGQIERWPRTWQSNGFEGYCTAQLVDGMAAWNNTQLQTEADGAILATKPGFLWRLNEPANSTSFAESSGNGGPPLVMADSNYGPATTKQAGVSGNGGPLPGDTGGQYLQLAGPDNNINIPTTVIQTGYRNSPVFSQFPSATSLPLAFSCAFWLQRGTTPSGGGGYKLILSSDFSSVNYQLLRFNLNTGPNTIGWFTSVDSGGFHVNGCGSSSDPWGDSQWHFYTCVVTISSTTCVITAYVDGVQVGTASTSTSGWPGPPYGMSNLQVGGAMNNNNFVYSNCVNGVWGKVALWNRALSVAEIQDMSNAGRGYSGELFTTRIARALTRGGYVTGTNNVPTPRFSQTGTSTLSPANQPPKTTVFTAINQALLAEMGHIWIDPDGATVVESRTDRYLRTAPTWIFGEDVAHGELPYTESVAYDFDPTYVYGDVTVQQTTGGTFTGGRPADVASTVRRYYQRSFTPLGTLDLDSAQQCQDYADWTFYSHRSPTPRARAVEFDPMAMPTVGWQAVLRLQRGTRVQLRRRPQGLGGPVFSADYFIEQISHGSINFDTSQGMPLSWKTIVVLTPAGGVAQPWILGDTTYSVLGSTTLPGF